MSGLNKEMIIFMGWSLTEVLLQTVALVSTDGMTPLTLKLVR